MAKEIKLAVALDASYFTDAVEQECIDREISTHYQDGSFYLDWSDDSMPEMKAWLVETYGEEIKKYETFAVSAT